MDKKVCFEKVAYGEVFFYEDRYYLKTAPSCRIQNLRGNCVDFDGGRHWIFKPYMEVIRIGPIDFQIERNEQI